jgi:hypothetical protein
MKLRFTHRALEAEQETIIEMRRIIHSVLVKDQCVGEGADFQQAVPVGVVSRQTGDFESHHNPGMAHAYLSDQTSKTLPPSSRGARLTLIAIDHDDSVVRPAECRCTRPKRILTLGTFDILNHLSHRRLSDV